MIDLKDFSKFQFSAFVSTIFDYLTFFILIAIGFQTDLSVFLGASLGAIVNFYINRKVVVKSTDDFSGEALKYSFVSIISAILNTLIFKLIFPFIPESLTARIITSLIVAIGWNYPLQKIWVFKFKQNNQS